MAQASLQFFGGRITRRQLLGLGLGVGGTAFLLSGFAGYRLFFHREERLEGFSLLSKPEVEFVRALSDAHFPQQNELGVPASDVPIAEGVDGWMMGMGSQEQMIVRTLLAVVDRWPQITLSSGQRFSALPFPDRVQMLKNWEEKGNDATRGLAELLRTVVSLHYFEDQRVLAAMGLRLGCGEIPV